MSVTERTRALLTLIGDGVEGWDLGDEVSVEFFEPAAAWKALIEDVKRTEAVEAALRDLIGNAPCRCDDYRVKSPCSKCRARSVLASLGEVPG